MLHFLKKAVDDASSDQRGKISAIYLLLFAINGVAWAWAVIALADRPTLLGTAVLAYVFGLRHAVDADHIAAIDNVVRKLMQEGKQPVAVGLVLLARAFASDRGGRRRHRRGGLRAEGRFRTSDRSAA